VSASSRTFSSVSGCFGSQPVKAAICSCAVPIVHKTGDVAPEKNGTSHWWQNHGAVPSKLISVDLFPVADKMNEKMM
jgi:hypothetical protein